MLNMIKNFIVATWQRLKSDTPRYWRRISLIGALLAGLSTFLSENDAIVPEKYKWITKYVAAASAAAALVSRFATTDTELAQKSDDLLLKKNKNENIDTV